MKITKRRQHHEVVTFMRYFARRNQKGAGFAFKCDESGNLIETSPTLLESYNECLDGSLNVTDEGVVSRTSRWTEPASGNCDECGREVTLSGFTNTCACGADYNMSGSRLAPRSQWGEETGESVSDILAVDFGRGCE